MNAYDVLKYGLWGPASIFVVTLIYATIAYLVWDCLFIYANVIPVDFMDMFVKSLPMAAISVVLTFVHQIKRSNGTK